MKKVVTGRTYTFHPVAWDRFDPPYGVQTGQLTDGQTVRVVRLPGCPPPNTMGHAHIADASTGEFLGLVSVHSLQPRK